MMHKETQNLFKHLAPHYLSKIEYTEKFNKEKYCWTCFIRLRFMPEMHIQIMGHLPTFEKAVHFYIKNHREEYSLGALYFPDTNITNITSKIFSFPEQRELLEKIKKFYTPNSVRFIEEL